MTINTDFPAFEASSMIVAVHFHPIHSYRRWSTIGEVAEDKLDTKMTLLRIVVAVVLRCSITKSRNKICV